METKEKLNWRTIIETKVFNISDDNRDDYGVDYWIKLKLEMKMIIGYGSAEHSTLNPHNFRGYKTVTIRINNGKQIANGSEN